MCQLILPPLFSIHSVISIWACVRSEVVLYVFRMVRTVKLSYTTVPQAIEIIAQWRKAQSVVIRTAYNRVQEGKKDREILDLLRTMPQGKLDSWLTLSALKRARALHRANPGRTVVFGRAHNLQLRGLQGQFTAEEWKAKRLLPLSLERDTLRAMVNREAAIASCWTSRTIPSGFTRRPRWLCHSR